MAPNPEDATPKAPDKSDKKDASDKVKDKSVKEAATGKEGKEDVLNLNDKELKALLDEAITYKNPKDREGKSELFNDLLLEAEETERIARATSAGGSELVRHCNPAARRQRHGGIRGRKTTGGYTAMGGRSISERGTHGGSLDNLAKEELFESTRRLRGGRKSSTSSTASSSSNMPRVSARQREGGSLPCNVNSGESAASIQFLEEAKRTKAMKDKDYTAIDMETVNLLENDHLGQSYDDQQQPVIEMTTIGGPKYTSKATLQISRANVDDPISMGDLDSSLESKRTPDYNALKAKVINSKYQVITPIASSTASYGTMRTSTDEKRSLDENGNALGHQTQSKSKKKKTDRNVNVMLAESIQGYKGEENVEDLLNYIEGNDGNLAATGKSRSLPKSKQLHKQHTTDEGGGKKKQKKSGKDSVGAGGDTGSRTELKKSNSLSEISGMKLDSEFAGSIASSASNSERSSSVKGDESEEKVVMRVKKDPVDRTRGRRSWGNVELSSFQPVYNTSSLENMETQADNWVVTRPKKKSKKRRNSVSSASGRLRPDLSRSNTGPSSSLDGHTNHRAPSPDLSTVIVVGGTNKMTRSMPHSEKSNDSSSDVDSVHSLPMDGPISYADIAKNMEKKKPSPEKPSSDRSATSIQPTYNHQQPAKEKSPQPSNNKPTQQPYAETEPRIPNNVTEKTPVVTTVLSLPQNTVTTQLNNQINNKNSVPDVNSIKSFPAIADNNNKNLPPDVHNFRSFPAITGSLSKLSTVIVQTAVNLSSNSSSFSTTSSDKAVQSTISYDDRTPAHSKSGVVICNNVGGANAAPATNPRVVPVQATNKKQSPNLKANNRSVKDSLKGGAVAQKGSVAASEGLATRQDCQKEQIGDVKTELSFMQATTEANSQSVVAAFNQKLPPDVPDVATIEKLQFMSMSPPLPAMSVSPQQQSTVQNQQAVNSSSPPNTQNTTKNQKRNRNNNRDQQQPQHEINSLPKSNDMQIVDRQQSQQGSERTSQQQRVGQKNSQPTPPKSSDTSYCDSSKNDELTSSCHLVNGVLEDPSQIIPPEPAESPPAVIILSGSLNKEVPQDLVFGFDINEQLLQEDAEEDEEEEMEDTGGGGRDCEDLAARYITPSKEATLSAHSLELIVNYIGSAWEQIISSQKVQYYSDGL